MLEDLEGKRQPISFPPLFFPPLLFRHIVNLVNLEDFAASLLIDHHHILELLSLFTLNLAHLFLFVLCVFGMWLGVFRLNMTF